MSQLADRMRKHAAGTAGLGRGDVGADLRDAARLLDAMDMLADAHNRARARAELLRRQRDRARARARVLLQLFLTLVDQASEPEKGVGR